MNALMPCLSRQIIGQDNAMLTHTNLHHCLFVISFLTIISVSIIVSTIFTSHHYQHVTSTTTTTITTTIITTTTTTPFTPPPSQRPST